MGRGQRLPDGLFTTQQAQQLIRVKIEYLALDSAAIKVHADGTRAPKKEAEV